MGDSWVLSLPRWEENISFSPWEVAVPLKPHSGELSSRAVLSWLWFPKAAIRPV